MLFLAVILSCFVAIKAGKILHTIKEEFEQIKEYELIHFPNLDSIVVGNETNILEFDAFGQHFKFELTVRDNFPLVVNHPQRDPDLPPAHVHELCHYKGRVLEPYHPTRTQWVTISFCGGRGVRAWINLHNDRFIIHPAAFHFNPDHETDHQLHDTHLIYSHSANFPGSFIKTSKLPHLRHGDTRRRLPWGGKNQVEFYTFADPSYCDKFRGDIDKMVNWYQDFINAASDEYENENWPYNLGTWEIRWVRLDVAESYSGEFRGMKYDFDSDTYDGKDEGSGYMRLFRDWADKNVDQEFDFGGIYTQQGDGGAAAWNSGVCGSSRYGRFLSTGNADRQRKLVAHELGHCLGMAHDENEDGDDDYTCPDGDIMGDGDHNSGWSSCSHKYLRDFLEKKNGASCLKKKDASFVINKGNGDESGGNPNDDNNNDDDGGGYNPPPSGGGGGGGGGGSCGLEVDHLKVNSERMDGDWKRTGQKFGGAPSYVHEDGDFYLFKANDGGWYWTISEKLGDPGDWDYGWCERTKIADCSGEWDDGSQTDDNCEFIECGSFTAKKEQCIVDNTYSDAICVSVDGEEEQVYGLDEDMGCVLDQPVFQYDEEETAMIKYLHYTTRYGWVISIDKVLASGVYMCNATDLLECTEGTWRVDMEDEDTAWVESLPTMTVKACGSYGEEAMKSKASSVALANVFLVIVVVMIVFGFGCIYMKKRKNTFKGEKVEDEEEEEQSIEVECEAEQSDDGATATVETHMN